MLKKKRLLLFNQGDPNLLFEDLFNGSALNTNLWTKTDTYASEEQVTNGTFDSDITGWTDASSGTGSIAWSSGKMALDAGAAGAAKARQSITTIANHPYQLTFTKAGDPNVTMAYRIGTSAGGNEITGANAATGSNTVNFTATGTTTWLEFSSSANGPITLDTVSVLATSGLIAVSGGKLNFAGSKTTPVWNDPALVSKAPYFWNRVAGLTIEWQITPTAADKFLQAGFFDGALDVNEAHSIYPYNSGYIGVGINDAIVTPFAYSAGQSLWGKIVCKATGALYYISTDNRVTWILVWIDSSVTASPLYLFIKSYNAALTSNEMKVYRGSVKPSTLSATPAASSPSLGAELDSGNLVVGNWYSITATQANYFYTGCAIGHEFRASATTVLDANNKVKLISLASAHVLVGDAGKKNNVYRCHPTASTGSPQGMAICVDDETNPAYELQAFTNGTNVTLVKRDNGTETSLIDTTTGVTYAAARELRAVVSGNSVAVYYESTANVFTQIDATQTVTMTSYGTRVTSFDPAGAGNCGLIEVDG